MEPSEKPSSFLRLPRGVRDKIYRMVLTVPYPLHLFRDTGSRKVELFAPGRPAQWLALLYTNRQLRTEASAMLYSSNTFTLVDTPRKEADLLQSFLDLIGDVNASRVSRLCISLPVVEKAGAQGQNATLGEEDAGARVLNLLTEKCSGLTTLEMFVHSRNPSGLTGAGDASETSARVVQEALARVDGELKSIPALSKIVVKLYDGPLAPDTAALMQTFGWIVSAGR